MQLHRAIAYTYSWRKAFYITEGLSLFLPVADYLTADGRR